MNEILKYVDEVIEKNSRFNKDIFKVVIFILCGVFIFYVLQNVFLPKRYPYDIGDDAGKLKYFYNEKPNSIDVLISGTSHSSRGILPMELYDNYGIKSYNLSTAVQPIEVTYYTLCEALKSQNLKVFIFDVSNLYFSDVRNTIIWKNIIDDMSLGKNKYLLSQECVKNCNNISINELLFPLLSYHTRWNDLSLHDFEFSKTNNRYFGKGGQIDVYMASGLQEEQMNEITSQLMQNTEKRMYQYDCGEYSEIFEENILYSTDIPAKNISWFLKIKNLCDENNIKLLAIKVPAIHYPQVYGSAWTIEKHKTVKSLCNQYEIDFYDLLYDADIGFDNLTDSQDGGYHLNLYGAQKVSSELGRYLQTSYHLPNKRSQEWDKDLWAYQKVCQVALLELEQDFITYINMIVDKYNDKIIFLVASDDMSQGLNDLDITALRTLGLQMDFLKGLQNAYIAVIENGMVKYEAMSNRSLSYQGMCGGGIKYDLYSSGWWTRSGASIKLEQTEFAVCSRGLNIVVYDADLDCIFDSVGFDTSMEHHVATRNAVNTNNFIMKYEHYLMGNE